MFWCCLLKTVRFSASFSSTCFDDSLQVKHQRIHLTKLHMKSGFIAVTLFLLLSVFHVCFCSYFQESWWNGRCFCKMHGSDFLSHFFFVTFTMCFLSFNTQCSMGEPSDCSLSLTVSRLVIKASNIWLTHRTTSLHYTFLALAHPNSDLREQLSARSHFNFYPHTALLHVCDLVLLYEICRMINLVVYSNLCWWFFLSGFDFCWCWNSNLVHQ